MPHLILFICFFPFLSMITLLLLLLLLTDYVVNYYEIFQKNNIYYIVQCKQNALLYYYFIYFFLFVRHFNFVHSILVYLQNIIMWIKINYTTCHVRRLYLQMCTHVYMKCFVCCVINNNTNFVCTYYFIVREIGYKECQAFFYRH